MDREQIEQEAAKRYLKGSASYYAFIYGVEWVLNKVGNREDGQTIDNPYDRGGPAQNH